MYSSGASLWYAVPYIGSVISMGLQTIIGYRAFQISHGLSRVRAMLVALVPFILILSVLAVSGVVLLVFLNR